MTEIVEKEIEPEPQDKIIVTFVHRGKSKRVDVTKEGMEDLDSETIGMALGETLEEFYDEVFSER